MGVVNVVMTVVSMSLIEKAGRRILHLVGLGGMFIAASLLSVSTVVLSKIQLVIS